MWQTGRVVAAAAFQTHTSDCPRGSGKQKTLDESRPLVMKRAFYLFATWILCLALCPAMAQVAPSATGSHTSLSAGGLFTVTQPDFDPNLTTITNDGVVTSSNHLYGIGGFVDYRMSRWVQLEAEGRWERWNQTQGYTINENQYAIGIRDPIHTFGHITPYAKVMAGLGTANFLTGRAALFSYGGGMDYRLTKRISLRADFEQQSWRVTPTMKPYTGAIGFSYRIF